MSLRDETLSERALEVQCSAIEFEDDSRFTYLSAQLEFSLAGKIVKIGSTEKKSVHVIRIEGFGE